MGKIEIYDTTLRDGTQAEDFNLSLEDKIRITKKLDELGIHYIEGGWPGSNPKDVGYFQEIKHYALKCAKITAFGSTHHPATDAAKDPNLSALVQAQTEVITIFGKSWIVHVRDALRTTPERNLELIRDSLAFLRSRARELFYDAEHFFDGFKDNPTYALASLKTALAAGADCLVLCDTNGGTLTSDLQEIIKRVKEELPPGTSLGIHTHNDAELAVANALAAVALGVSQVQGTMNGVGERCGNANLCSIIPAIMLKLKLECIGDEQLGRLREISRYILEFANIPPNKYQPYVGRCAFAHKGGVHVSAVERNPETYEHIQPELVGNRRRTLVSDLAGRSTIIRKAKKYGVEISSKDPIAMQVLEEVKQLENEGFQYEAAEGSFELLLNRAVGNLKRYFELIGYRVLVSKHHESQLPTAEATIMLKVGGKVEHTAATGVGPVNALDNALRKALERFYPQLATMRLSDYKVRVLPGTNGTGAKVRVLIESVDTDNVWSTVGVSYDILEASWQALVDSFTYKLFRDEKYQHLR
jgi:2-isopropylmalate synthase